ncbi:MAG TPA: hypothetical protein VNT99_14115 [Methylomirabilota bacterium]|nr:hypothetical protein [Methylomirabilota bacterium]
MDAEINYDWGVRDADALDGGDHTDFDYDAVERALGSRNGLDDEGYARLAQAFVVVLTWMLNTRLCQGADAFIGRRAIAAAWVLKPEMFNGLSQTQVAALIGQHKMAISKSASDFSRVFGIRNRGQMHGHNFKVSATSTNPLPDVSPVAPSTDEKPEARLAA